MTKRYRSYGDDDDDDGSLMIQKHLNGGGFFGSGGYRDGYKPTSSPQVTELRSRVFLESSFMNTLQEEYVGVDRATLLTAIAISKDIFMNSNKENVGRVIPEYDESITKQHLKEDIVEPNVSKEKMGRGNNGTYEEAVDKLSSNMPNEVSSSVLSIPDYTLMTVFIQKKIEECLHPYEFVNQPCGLLKVLHAMIHLQLLCFIYGKRFTDTFVDANGIDMLKHYLTGPSNSCPSTSARQNKKRKTNVKNGNNEHRQYSYLSVPVEMLVVAWSLLYNVCHFNDLAVWKSIRPRSIKKLIRTFAHCGETVLLAESKMLNIVHRRDGEGQSTDDNSQRFFASISKVLNPSQATRGKYISKWVKQIFALLLFDDDNGNHENLTRQEAEQGLDFLHWIFSTSSEGKSAVRKAQPNSFRDFLNHLVWKYPESKSFRHYQSEFMGPFEWVIVRLDT